MKVLHISGASSWGGNEQQLLILVNELNRYGVEQYLFCFENSPLHIRSEKFKLNVNTIKKSKPFSSYYRTELANLVFSEKIEIIHLHTSDSVTGFLLTDLFFHLKIPTVFSKKGMGRKISFLSKIKYNYKNIASIICVSEETKEKFSQIIQKKNHYKLITINDGIQINNKFEKGKDLKAILNLSQKTFIIGNIANHTRAKDLPSLIIMVNEIVNKFGMEDIHLIQIGEESKITSELKELIKTYGLQKYISVLGFVENASAFLPQFDVFIISSEREGGPSSALEAFYHKTPVISTQVGVMKEAIQDGINGFLVPPRQPESLAEKVIILKQHPGLKERFKEAAYSQFLKKYTSEIMGKKTFDHYRSLLNKI